MPIIVTQIMKLWNFGSFSYLGSIVQVYAGYIPHIASLKQAPLLNSILKAQA
jgi:hypothetical protein